MEAFKINTRMYQPEDCKEIIIFEWDRSLSEHYSVVIEEDSIIIGFDMIGLKRIIAVVKPDNIASRKVIEKIGMKLEKILKVDDIYYSGYDGELYYALTKDEYSKYIKE